MSIPGQQPVLVGRTQEQLLLRSLHADLLTGRGSLVLISGEAGIGKTALIGDFTSNVPGDESLLLSGGCYDLTTTPPYGPWIEIVRSYSAPDGFPAMPHQLQPGGGMAGVDSQAALFDLAGRFLADVASVRPLMIVLEDMHWADSASLDLLRYLARTLKDLPVLFLATYREDEISRGHALAALLPVFVRETTCKRLELIRLSEDAVQAIVRARYRLSAADETRLVTHLLRLADGNPFFTNELMYALEVQRLLRPVAGGWHLDDVAHAGVPLLIQHAVGARVLRLSAGARKLLELASIIGFEADLGILAELFEGTAGAFDDATQEVFDHHLLRIDHDGHTVEFSHALVRQVVYEEITILQRQRMHKQVGQALVLRPRSEFAAIASHFEKAGDERGTRYHLAAAERAQKLFAADAVVGHCTRGIELGIRTGAELPHALYRLRGLAREATGEIEIARLDLETSLNLAHQRGDAHGEWQALLDLSGLWASRDYGTARQYCERAVQIARSLDETSVIATTLNRLGNTLANTGDIEQALACHQEALDLFEAAADTTGIARTLDFTAMVHYLGGDLPMASAYYERAIPLLRQSDDRYALSSALGCIAGTSVGDWTWRVSHIRELPLSIGPDAATVLTEAIAIARSIDWRAGEAFALFVRGSQAAMHGDVDDAFTFFSDAQAIAERIEHRHWIGQTLGRVGSIYLELMNGEQSRIWLRLALENGEQTASHAHVANCIGWMASANVQTGDMASAQLLFDESAYLIREPRSGGVRNILFAQAEYQLALGQPDAAMDTINRLVASIPQGSGRCTPWLSRLTGDVQVSLGLLDDAEQQLQTALADADALGMHLIRWRILASLARLYLARHSPEQGTTYANEALSAVERLARLLPAEDSRRTLLDRALGEIPLRQPYRRARPSLTTFAGLTPRELDVLRIVAEGLTDAEVGQRLFISARTVSQHLRSVYSKLGVTTRTAAVRVASEHELLQ